MSRRRGNSVIVIDDESDGELDNETLPRYESDEEMDEELDTQEEVDDDDDDDNYYALTVDIEMEDDNDDEDVENEPKRPTNNDDSDDEDKICDECGRSNKYDLKCPVCLGRVNGKNPFSTICGHIFCENCLKAAVLKTNRCPLCQNYLTGSGSMHRIYI